MDSDCFEKLLRFFKTGHRIWSFATHWDLICTALTHFSFFCSQSLNRFLSEWLKIPKNCIFLISPIKKDILQMPVVLLFKNHEVKTLADINSSIKEGCEAPQSLRNCILWCNEYWRIDPGPLEVFISLVSTEVIFDYSRKKWIDRYSVKLYFLYNSFFQYIFIFNI